MRIKTSFAFVFACLLPGLSAAQGQPLSAIDWLSVLHTVPPLITDPDAAGIAPSAAIPDVDVQSLEEPSVGGVGLLPATVTGLPSSLWQGSNEADLIRTLEPLQMRRPSVPALTALLHVLMLAEADPPAQAAGDALLEARINLLYQHGLLAPAEAMLDRVGTLTPRLFDQAFDLALLSGTDAAACAMLDSAPHLSTDLSVRIWCATRDGDFLHALTLYNAGAALGALSDLDAELLVRFLDPDYSETAASMRPPVRPAPLQFRLFEAVGEALPTAPLPLPFAVVDLSGDSGWRAQVQAAERLARAGALEANLLLGIYTAQRPAASGGIWDRVAALQRFEQALNDQAPDDIAQALVSVWPQMRAAGLLVPFSNIFAPQMNGIPLSDRAQFWAAMAGLLSDDYEAVAQTLRTSEDDRLAFLAALALGQPPAQIPEDLPNASALAAAWQLPPQVPERLALMRAENRLGEALLQTIVTFDAGARGQNSTLTEALSALRAFGLEDIARRAALQRAILDMDTALQ